MALEIEQHFYPIFQEKEKFLFEIKKKKSRTEKVAENLQNNLSNL